MNEVLMCPKCGGEQLPVAFAGKLKEFIIECHKCGALFRLERDERGRLAYVTRIYEFADDQGEGEQK